MQVYSRSKQSMSNRITYAQWKDAKRACCESYLSTTIEGANGILLYSYFLIVLRRKGNR